MTLLTSKVQFNNFEVGEFVEEKKRNYEETIDLIEKFPWNKQREKIIIELTNPSITIEGQDNHYLKLAVFFNGKFVLHYLDNEQVLFTKSFVDLIDTYKYLEKYFTKTFDTTDFKKQNTWLKHNLNHFISQDFKYTVTSQTVKKFLWSTSAISFAYSLFVILLFLFKGGIRINEIGIVTILLSMFLIGGGLNLILFLNYYNYVKDKILIMSKGNDTFYFGKISSPTKFNKSEIVQVTTIQSRSYKSPINAFAVVIIKLRDDTIIKIPNLLIEHFNLEQKLYKYPKIDKGGFPLL
jgi:hypothetical protein